MSLDIIWIVLFYCGRILHPMKLCCYPNNHVKCNPNIHTLNHAANDKTNLYSSNISNDEHQPMVQSIAEFKTFPDLVSRLPTHIGFILDGNARWARKRMLPIQVGHIKGADRGISTLKLCKELNIEYVTMYVLSAENMKRDQKELQDIMGIVYDYVTKFKVEAKKEGIRIKILGDLTDQNDDHSEKLPIHLTKELFALQEESDSWPSHSSIGPGENMFNNSNSNQRTTVCLAINYGARQDIINACKRIALKSISDESLLNEESLKQELSTRDLPDPDLIIRTAGEKRLSNFLLWEAAYSELYFSDALWPDFDERELTLALVDYCQRERRYGKRNKETQLLV